MNDGQIDPSPSNGAADQPVSFAGDVAKAVAHLHGPRVGEKLGGWLGP